MSDAGEIIGAKQPAEDAQSLYRVMACASLATGLLCPNAQLFGWIYPNSFVYFGVLIAWLLVFYANWHFVRQTGLRHPGIDPYALSFFRIAPLLSFGFLAAVITTYAAWTTYRARKNPLPEKYARLLQFVGLFIVGDVFGVINWCVDKWVDVHRHGGMCPPGTPSWLC